MEKIIQDFGIQPMLLTAQIVNFLILLFLLNKFLYKPILKVLEERKQKIAESLKNAEEIEATLAKTEEDRDKKLLKAIDEAKQIIEEAKQSASQIVADAHQKAQVDVSELIEKTRSELASEKDKLHQEIRAEVAEVVVMTLEKVTNKVLTDSDKKKIQSQTLNSL